MRKRLYLSSGLLIAASAFYIMGCNGSSDDKTSTATTTEKKAMSHDEMIKAGEYIVMTGGCNDCHSPKKMTNMGPVIDSSKLLSGHPGDEPLPPIDAKALQPGNWIQMAPDITAFVGPWGISYAINLTSDSATGIGAWTEDQFVSALRTGKHLGNGRPILPPMPWDVFGKKTDEDLKAVFAFLKSLPAISNRVPGPVTPPDVMKMIGKK